MYGNNNTQVTVYFKLGIKILFIEHKKKNTTIISLDIHDMLTVHDERNNNDNTASFRCRRIKYTRCDRWLVK